MKILKKNFLKKSLREKNLKILILMVLLIQAKFLMLIWIITEILILPKDTLFLMMMKFNLYLNLLVHMLQEKQKDSQHNPILLLLVERIVILLISLKKLGVHFNHKIMISRENLMINVESYSE